ncbi:hypothetical protein [Methylobacterium segetis]|uniref:hypothetical protein n=1 Tax=Methylobacterium segetis TaxID=2488750 RepID=UPI001FE1B83E|nr:hypothetical protein [Methylobacterium segetis]
MTRERREPHFDALGGADIQADGAPTAPALRPFGAARFTLRATAAAAVIAVLSLYARNTIRTDPPVREPEQAVTVAFVPASALPVRPALPIAEAGPRLRLEDPAGFEAIRPEPARINAATSLREASLSRGDFSAIEESHLRVTLTQGVTSEPTPSLFVALARRAADGPGLSVTRTGERGRVVTKFGAVETLEAVLAGGTSRTCTGFLSLEAAPVRLEGWLCAPLARPPEAAALACALDGLALDGSADAATEAVFREAAARRDPRCRSENSVSTVSDQGGQTGSIGPARIDEKIRRKRGENVQARP